MRLLLAVFTAVAVAAAVPVAKPAIEGGTKMVRDVEQAGSERPRANSHAAHLHRELEAVDGSRVARYGFLIVL
jgi:hypothetical protein